MVRHRRRRRRGKPRRGSRWRLAGGVILGTIAVFAIGYGFALLIEARQTYVELDAASNCPKAGPSAITALVIDTTDPLNLIQRTDLLNEVEGLLATIPRFGAFQMYAVGPIEEEPPRPLFSRCNPGRASEISELTGNPAMVEKQWREGFRAPLDEVLSEMLAGAEAKTSPILESIQWVAINALTLPLQPDIPRRLVIVSDLLQHTAALSHYRDPTVSFETFAKTPYFLRVRAPLDGVAIDLLMVNRASLVPVQRPKIINFWTDYFDAQGASRLRIVGLAG